MVQKVAPEHGGDAQAEQGAWQLPLVVEAQHDGDGEGHGIDSREKKVAEEHVLGERVPLKIDHLGVDVGELIGLADVRIRCDRTKALYIQKKTHSL